MYKGRAHLILILGLGLAGCLTPAAQKQKPQDVTAGPTRPRPVAIYEEDTTAIGNQIPKDSSSARATPVGDTAASSKRDTVILVKASGDMVKTPVQAAPKDTTTGKVTEAAPKTIPGYRVQVFASTSRGNAEKVFSEARRLLGEKAYLEVAPPLYKVRVGNCLTQQEALPLKERAIEKGYKSAFVVETDIEL
jgi:cell division septation protein DedD